MKMEKEGHKLGMEQVRARIQVLRDEIMKLLEMDQAERLARQSQVGWDVEARHEARIARITQIRDEIAKLTGRR